MLNVTIAIISFSLLAFLNQGCGVKGKPQPPLQEPYISSGSLEADTQRKQKNKKKTFSPENEVQSHE